MLVSERRIAADSATARAPTVPGRSAPYPYSTGRLVTHVFRQAHALRLRCLRPHRRGPRGVTYDTVLATRRLGGRRRGVARGSPPPHRVVARGSERRSLARPRAPCRLAGGAGRAGILDVQARGRRETAWPRERPTE